MSATRNSPTIGSACLTAISSHCLAALPAKTCAFNSYMRQNAYTTVTWSASSKLCCHVIITQ